MSSKVAEADRYLKTQQQDNDTGEETHTHNTLQQSHSSYRFFISDFYTDSKRLDLKLLVDVQLDFNTTQCTITGGMRPNIFFYI